MVRKSSLLKPFLKTLMILGKGTYLQMWRCFVEIESINKNIRCFSSNFRAYFLSFRFGKDIINAMLPLIIGIIITYLLLPLIDFSKNGIFQEQ